MQCHLSDPSSANSTTAVNEVRGRLYDNVFRQKKETFYVFCLFVYKTTLFWGLETHNFENRFQSASF